jgi:hypothetical protein
LTVRCAGNKRDGSLCTATVKPPQRFCWWHDPQHATQRRRAASKAGKSRGPSRELVGIKQRLSDLADDVLEGTMDKGVAAVASQVLNVYLRAVSVELKAKEQLELTERLERLEEALEHNQRGAGRWGA